MLRKILIVILSHFAFTTATAQESVSVSNTELWKLTAAYCLKYKSFVWDISPSQQNSDLFILELRDPPFQDPNPPPLDRRKLQGLLTEITFAAVRMADKSDMTETSDCMLRYAKAMRSLLDKKISKLSESSLSQWSTRPSTPPSTQLSIELTPYEACVRTYIDRLLESHRNTVTAYNFSSTRSGFIAFNSGARIQFDPNQLRPFLQSLIPEGIPRENWIDHFSVITNDCTHDQSPKTNQQPPLTIEQNTKALLPKTPLSGDVHSCKLLLLSVSNLASVKINRTTVKNGATTSDVRLLTASKGHAYIRVKIQAKCQEEDDLTRISSAGLTLLVESGVRLELMCSGPNAKKGTVDRTCESWTPYDERLHLVEIDVGPNILFNFSN